MHSNVFLQWASQVRGSGSCLIARLFLIPKSMYAAVRTKKDF